MIYTKLEFEVDSARLIQRIARLKPPGRSSVLSWAYPVSGTCAMPRRVDRREYLAKAMIKQIDRVISDLCGQSGHFKTKSPDSITVAIVGVNLSHRYVSYEGGRIYPTGQFEPHPIQEAPEAERRLLASAEPCFNEFLILPFVATNEPPFPFEWARRLETRDAYASVLVRLLRAYARRS